MDSSERSARRIAERKAYFIGAAQASGYAVFSVFGLDCILAMIERPPLILDFSHQSAMGLGGLLLANFLALLLLIFAHSSFRRSAKDQKWWRIGVVAGALISISMFTLMHFAENR